MPMRSVTLISQPSLPCLRQVDRVGSFGPEGGALGGLGALGEAVGGRLKTITSLWSFLRDPAPGRVRRGIKGQR